MKITYIHHSCFLVETRNCYYLFDYEKGVFPEMNAAKPIFVLSSHGHPDHYNPEVFSILKDHGMQTIYAVLADDIEISEKNENVMMLQVFPGKEYVLSFGQKLSTLQSTDLGVAFLIEDDQKLIYHAGDLNDWVWDEEPASYNEEMTKAYRKQIALLSEKLDQREIDIAFVVLDPRQEKDYDRGMCYFLEHVPVKTVYPMHYWNKPDIISKFMMNHPEYTNVQKTE